MSPATYSMLSDMFPRDRLGRAVGDRLSFIGGGLAFLIGGYVINLLKRVDTVVLPLLGALRPWQVTFFVVGLPGLLVALLILLTVRDPGRRGLRLADGRASKPPSATPSASWRGTGARSAATSWASRSTRWHCSRCWAGRRPSMRKFAWTRLYAGRGGAANTAGVFCGGWLMDALARPPTRRCGPA